MNSDSTLPSESNFGRKPPPNVTVPPCHIYMTVGDISIEKHALIGITFYEIFRKGDEGRLRAHFIKSIYDMAWKKFA
jgi:hypothetical protein